MFYNILTSAVMEFDDFEGYYTNLITDEEYRYAMWDERKLDIISKIKDYNSDIIIMSEVSKNVSLPFLKDELSNLGYSFSIYKEKNVFPGFGSVIFYRNCELAESDYYSLKRVENSPIKHSSNVVFSKFIIDSSELNIMGFHLNWVKESSQKSKDPNVFPAYYQINYLLENDCDFNINDKWLFCGDFNTKAGSSIEDLFIKERGLIDTHADDHYYTCNVGDNGATKVDYMYLSPDIKFKVINLEDNIIDEYTPMPSKELGIPSDHLPICIDVVI